MALERLHPGLGSDPGDVRDVIFAPDTEMETEVYTGLLLAPGPAVGVEGDVGAVRVAE